MTDTSVYGNGDILRIPTKVRKPKVVLLVTSMQGLMIKCSECEQEWFDSWVAVDGTRYCGECFERLYGTDVRIGNRWRRRDTRD